MENVISTLVMLHGYFRWIVALVAILALLKFVVGWLSKSRVSNTDKLISKAFAGVMSFQLVVGLINLLSYLLLGIFNPRVHMEHAVYGLIATGLSHALPLRKDDRPDTTRFRTSSILVMVSLLLILLSVIRLRGGWNWE